MRFAHYQERRRREIRRIFGAFRSVKTIFILFSAVIILGAAAGGTLAWMVVRSNPVENTFTTDGVNITLTESDTGDGDGNAATNTYAMTPGADISKDPKISVDAYSMPCYLFVQLQKSENVDDFITYAMAPGWQALDGADNVYYCLAPRAGAIQEFPVFENNQVHVREDVTHEMLRGLTEGNYPVITVVAYAVQSEGIPTVQDAWAAANP